MARIQYESSPVFQKQNLPTYPRGSRAHQPGRDSEEKQQVVTVGLENNRKMRIGTIHVHLDGTWKFWASRAGKHLGYVKNIMEAGIERLVGEDVQEEASSTQALDNVTLACGFLCLELRTDWQLYT